MKCPVCGNDMVQMFNVCPGNWYWCVCCDASYFVESDE